jgi:hypothetical protein
MDRVFRRKSAIALLLERHVDQHDAILLHDSDQQDNADNADHVQRPPDQHERNQCAETGRRERRQNRQRVNGALIEDAEDNIDSEQRCEDQRRRSAERALEGLRVALEACGDRPG